ncbi:MAG: DUF4340 domain-containing protein [Verrucomicrobiae bacterium]|nr:DUF4340 domain-containing protein [Verrucomicrobiae bacterium]
MNWRNTLRLLAIAAALALFILLLERPARLAHLRAAAVPRIVPAFAPASVTSLEIRSASNIVHLEKPAARWEIAGPTRRPAQGHLIDDLLRRIAELSGRSVLSIAELRANPQITAEFGLNPPILQLTASGPESRLDLLFGVRNVTGSHVFFQVSGQPGIFTAPASLLDGLPASPEAWRDTTLLPLAQLRFDRIRVAGPAAAFTLVRPATNRNWEIAEPRPARADSDRVHHLLGRLQTTQIRRFLPPAASPAPEAAGLQPPRLVLSLLQGPREVFSLALGAPSAPDGSILAQRADEEDLLVVPAETLDLLRLSYKDLLDRRILRFDPANVAELVVETPDPFRLVRQSGAWRLWPSDVPADSQLVQRLLLNLVRLEFLDIAKEVVTDLDLPTYGLAPPTARLSLHAQPGDTNSPLAILETGFLRDNRVFARVPGEDSVYALNPADAEELPTVAWRWRDRSLWRFDPAQVASIAVRNDGLDWSIRRVAENDYLPSPGWRNTINPFALEEALFELGQSRALRWVELGDARAHLFGTTSGPQVTLEFRAPAPLNPLHLAFGKTSASGHRYAAFTAPDGARLTFELPGPVFDRLWAEIGFTEAGRNAP